MQERANKMAKKVMIHAGKNVDQAKEIIRQHDGDTLANYGQSMLVRVDDEGLDELRRAKFRVRELAEEPIVRMGGFELNSAAPEALSTAATALEQALPSGRSHHVLRLAGPLHPDWKQRLQREGVTIDQALSESQYLISVDSQKVDELQNLDYVEAVSPFYAALKVNPTLLDDELDNVLTENAALSPLPRGAEETQDSDSMTRHLMNSTLGGGAPVEAQEEGNLELVLFDAADQLATIDAVRNLGARVVKTPANMIIVAAELPLVPQLAKIPQIREVNPYRPPGLTNNVATGIIHVDTLQRNHELDGSGQIVGVADSGLDTGVNDATMLSDFRGRIVSIYALGRPGDASDLHNHGTHVTGSVLGNGANSNGNIQGMAPAAQVVFQSTMDASRGLGGLPADLRSGLYDVARADGARIHTNSWSTLESNGAYLGYASQTDDFAFANRDFLILFSAGNDAPLRVNSPGTAKNALTVGSCESDRPLPGSVSFPASPAYPSGATWPNFDDQADNQNQVANFSCPGPAQNNRRKPDVVAPGTFILSTRSTVSTDDRGPDGIPGTDDEDGVFTHAEAVGLGLPGEPVFGTGDQDTPNAPAGSGPDVTQNYYYSNGTSMSTPITAGSCALVRQFLVEQRGHTPSAALVKAIIINGGVDMGMGLFDNGQGWGRIDLVNSLYPPGTQHVQFDDDLSNAVATGDIRSYDIFVSSAATPLSVTLVWRDPAGSTIQNRLHLRVIHAATSTESTADPIGDIRNNVQRVIVSPPQVGLYRIEVEGINVTTGVPELPGALRQDYALVVAGATGFSCNPSDIVQVIDRSGSMGTSGYMEPAKERAQQLIDLLQINDRAGVVAFASSASEQMALTPIDSQEDKDDAHTAIDPLSAGGTTDLREALERGLTTLGPDAGRPRAMVFLSDGKHTVPTPEIDDPFLDSLVAANTRVYSIALGPATDFAVLNNIASRTGTGAVYTVESAADLHKLHEVYYDILGSMSCGGMPHLSSAPLGLDGVSERSATVNASAREALFAVSWTETGVEIEFRLIAPSGKVYGPDSKDVFFFRGSTHAMYRVATPQAGRWKLVIKHRGGAQRPLWVTAAALIDSDASCEVRVDPKYLFEDKLLLRLGARHVDRPLVGGRALARITFPTVPVAALLHEYASELKEIRLDEERLKGDKDDIELIKLGLLIARYGTRGKDLLERKEAHVKLLDDGIDEDPRANDGVYTAFFEPKRAGVAGSFQIQMHFAVQDEKLGLHECTRLIPVYVPARR
jgi:hypothetical protein